jgi:Intracellular septation protein A
MGNASEALDPMWVQIKVTLFNALVAFILWIGLRAEKNFFRFVFHKTFHFTEEGWHNLTRNAALFFLATGRTRRCGLGLPMPTHRAQSRLDGHRYLDSL